MSQGSKYFSTLILYTTTDISKNGSYWLTHCYSIVLPLIFVIKCNKKLIEATKMHFTKRIFRQTLNRIMVMPKTVLNEKSNRF